MDRIDSLLQSLQTGCGAKGVFYSVGNRGCFLEGEVTGKWRYSSVSSDSLGMSGVASLPSSVPKKGRVQ